MALRAIWREHLSVLHTLQLDIEACANVNLGGSRKIEEAIATLQTATRFLRDFVTRHFHDLVTGTAPRVGSWLYQDPDAEPWMTASAYRQWLHNDRRNRAWMHLQQLNQATNVVSVNFQGLELDGTLLPYYNEELRPQPFCPTSSTQVTSSSVASSSHEAPPEPCECNREPSTPLHHEVPVTPSIDRPEGTHAQPYIDLTEDIDWF
jgi:hypothetical protein